MHPCTRGAYRLSSQGLCGPRITTGAHSPVGGNLEFGGWIGMNVDGTVGFHSEGATRDSARGRLWTVNAYFFQGHTNRNSYCEKLYRQGHTTKSSYISNKIQTFQKTQSQGHTNVDYGGPRRLRSRGWINHSQQTFARRTVSSRCAWITSTMDMQECVRQRQIQTFQTSKPSTEKALCWYTQ